MKRIEQLSELSELIRGQFRRGVMTNAPFSPDAFSDEVAGETLYGEEIPGGLLLLRRREGFDRLSFYLQPGADFSQWKPEQDVVTEFPAKPGDPGAVMLNVLLENAGFQKKFTRIRMQRTGDSASQVHGQCSVTLAQISDCSAVLAFLYRFYDMQTGCLPTARELTRHIREGGVILAFLDGMPAGVLHMVRNRNTVQLRHIAVEPRFRGCGIGSEMLEFYFAHQEACKCQLWVAEDNGSARRLYEKNGFVPDGWTSTVWSYERKNKQ